MTVISKQTSPYIRRKSSVNRMMNDVIIAVSPLIIFALCIYQLKALMIFSISILTMLIMEFIYVGLRNKMPKDGQKHHFKEKFLFAYKGHYHLSNVLSPLVSALIFSLLMPANATWYSVFISSLLGITLGKLVFGGLGNNIFNPAALGFIISKICFESHYPAMDYGLINFFNSGSLDVVAGATPLANINSGLSVVLNSHPNQWEFILNLLIGRVGGSLGEASSLLIIIGAIYLIVRKSADYRPMLSYFVTTLFLIMASGAVICIVNPNNINYFIYVFYELLSGGLLFLMAFMVSDPVTMPITSPGRVLYGGIAGILTIFIRFFAATNEGAAFSLLIANMFVPMIDYYKFSSQQYTKKKIILMVSLLLISSLLLILLIIFYKTNSNGERMFYYG